MGVIRVLLAALGPSLWGPASHLPSPQALLNKAIVASLAARKDWDLKPVADRAQIFLKAADMLSGPRRAEVLAKTMVGQVRMGRWACPTQVSRRPQAKPF